MLHKQKHHRFAVLCTASVAAGTTILLRHGRGTSLRISISDEIQRALILVVEIVITAYVFRQASRTIETEIGFAAARQAWSFITNG
jgi:hypothetical protein